LLAASISGFALALTDVLACPSDVRCHDLLTTGFGIRFGGRIEKILLKRIGANLGRLGRAPNFDELGETNGREELMTIDKSHGRSVPVAERAPKSDKAASVNGLKVVSLMSIAAVSMLIAAAVFSPEIRDQAAVARPEISATARKEAPAVQHHPIVPANVLDPIDLQWDPRTGDYSN
jgi:hypothetical protein